MDGATNKEKELNGPNALDKDGLEFNDPPMIVWIRVQDALGLVFEGNPKLHDVGSLVESIKRHAFQEPPKFDAALGAIKAGNGRVEVLAMMERDGGHELPRGLAVEKGTGAWAMPVLVGTDAGSAAEAKAYLVDANNLTYSGGEGATPWDLMRMWDERGYLALLEGLAGEDVLPVSVDGDDLDALLSPGIDYDELWRGMPEFEQENAGAAKSIYVHFTTLEDVGEFAELVGQKITAKTKYIWYPKQERKDLKKYVAHES